MLPVKKIDITKEEERETLTNKPMDNTNRSVFSRLKDCLFGTPYVEVVEVEDENAFEDNEKDFGVLKIKEEDI